MTTPHLIIVSTLAAVLLFPFALAVVLHWMNKRRNVTPPAEPPSHPDFDAWYEAHKKKPYMGERLSNRAAWDAALESIRAKGQQ